MNSRHCSAILRVGQSRLRSPGAPNFCSHIRASYADSESPPIVSQYVTYLLDTKMDEKPGISRDHNINDALLAFLVPDVVFPGRERYGDRMRGEGWYRHTKGMLLFILQDQGGAHFRCWLMVA